MIARSPLGVGGRARGGSAGAGAEGALDPRRRIRYPDATMIRPRLLTALVSSALAVALFLFAGVAGAQQKVAVVDVQRAVASTEDGLRAQAMLKKMFDSKQQELNKKQSDLQRQREDIDKQAKVLPKDALEKRVGEWQKQMLELQQIFVEYNKELEKKQKELTDPVFEKIMQIVKRLATSENIDLVVDKATVAYVRGDLDLTDRCIQMYNSGGGAPAPAPPAAGGAAPKK
jgi:outer membrane protein